MVTSPLTPRVIVTGECTREEMIRTPTFYGLWACFFIACATGLMAISIALPVGIETVGLESGVATMLVSFFAIFNGGGRPLFGVLTDRFNPRNTAMLSFGLITLASPLLWQVATVPMYVLAFALLWESAGGHGQRLLLHRLSLSLGLGIIPAVMGWYI